MTVIATLCVSVSLDCKERRDDEFENRKRFCEVIVIKWQEVPQDCVSNQNAALSHAWRLALTALCRLGM